MRCHLQNSYLFATCKDIEARFSVSLLANKKMYYCIIFLAHDQRCGIFFFFRRFIIVSVILPFFLSLPRSSPFFSSSISILFRFALLAAALSCLPHLPFFPSLRTLYRKRRTKETVTSQLAKLLIYSLFNQINERVDVHFYAPVKLFMVYGNCPKRTCTSIVAGVLRPPLVQNSLPGRPPFFPSQDLSLARLSYVLYHFPLVLLPVRFFVYPPSASDHSKRPHGCLINGVSQSRGVTGL